MIETTYIGGYNLIIRKYVGVVTIEQVVDSIEGHLADDRIHVNVLAIEDVRDMATASLAGYDVKALRRLKDCVLDFVLRYGNARTAVLVKETAQMGLTRQFDFLASITRLKVRPFRDLAAAKVFLGLPGDLLLPLQ